MHTTLTTLIDRLDSSGILGTGVIRWAAPVPSFGDLSSATVATLGLNPSNREFVDVNGCELQGVLRRFHTLKSLKLRSWSEVSANHLQSILELCRAYFLRNPYDGWFKKLDGILGGTKTSYYTAPSSACHLDLIPYATASKWTDLSPRQRSALLTIAADTLALLLQNSSIRLLLMNGSTVVANFEEIAGAQLERVEMHGWTLSRQRKKDVIGVGYKGVLRSIHGVELSRPILVLGYNHNIQSSFGVTNRAVSAIQRWITESATEGCS